MNCAELRAHLEQRELRCQSGIGGISEPLYCTLPFAAAFSTSALRYRRNEGRCGMAHDRALTRCCHIIFLAIWIFHCYPPRLLQPLSSVALKVSAPEITFLRTTFPEPLRTANRKGFIPKRVPKRGRPYANRSEKVTKLFRSLPGSSRRECSFIVLVA